MSMSAHRSRLLQMTKELVLQWEQTRSLWTDVKSQEFERRYMQEVVARVERTTRVMEQLDQLLAKVRSDCE
jgi:hypothetical protein